jgi:hypothetical protein
MDVVLSSLEGHVHDEGRGRVDCCCCAIIEEVIVCGEWMSGEGGIHI